MKKFFLILLIIVSQSCKKKMDDCNFKSIETIFYTQSASGGHTSYLHAVLITDFCTHCRDSMTLVNIAIKYKDTVGNGKPCDVVNLYSSKDDFIPNETSQILSDINKSCLVSIWFKGDKPYRFNFYNSEGKDIYTGPYWKPNNNPNGNQIEY